MKQVIAVLLLLSVFTAPGFSQPGNNNYIPELVFQNPVLIAGEAGKDGAVYKFSNVAYDIDATVKIKARSGTDVKLTNIDVSNTGWNKAFQPQFGIPGNVPANKDWWMDFEMRFYKAGTYVKKKIKGFSVTAIDVDGDGVSIREYVQLNKIKSVTYCPVNYLVEQTPVATSSNGDDDDDDDDDYNYIGVNKRALGPVQNFTNIDTLGTPVMATYTYEEKDMISFRYGARSGSIISNAGERLNSLWFRSFNLVAPVTLPVTFYSYHVAYENNQANLSWSAQADEHFSHFVVERSTDGNTYQAIGQVQASTQVTNYRFTDMNISSATGLVYYRIQCREKSGEVNYSSVKLIKLNKEETVSLRAYPNPVQGIANLTLPAAWQNKPVLVSLFNSAGTQVQNTSYKAASQTETLDFSQLPKGMYVVKAQCNGAWAEQRILKN